MAAAALSREEQVEHLAQALLREYMHRKSFKRTLHEFDGECPRGANTISSRATMTSMLHCDTLQVRNKQRSVPFRTFMELLCSYRLRKRRLTQGDSDSSIDENVDVRRKSECTVRREAAEAGLAAARQRLEKAKRQLAEAHVSASSREGPNEEKEKKQKKEKKDKKEKDRKQKKEKKDKTDASHDESPARRAFDPLGISGPATNPSTDRQDLALQGVPHGLFAPHDGDRTHVGRHWAPTAAAPEVGLREHQDLQMDPQDLAPPLFLSGGMSLQANVVRASIDKEAHHRHPPTGGSSGTSPSVSPSPSRSASFSGKVYDPTATSRGVLKKTGSADTKRKGRRVVIVTEN